MDILLEDALCWWFEFFFDSFFLFSWKMFRSSPVFLVKNLGWSCHPKVWKLTKPQCCQCFFSSKNAAGVLSTAFGSKPAVWQSFELTLDWHPTPISSHRASSALPAKQPIPKKTRKHGRWCRNSIAEIRKKYWQSPNSKFWIDLQKKSTRS